ncbi:MAG: amidase [Acidimicrobiales bacterium]
MNLNELSLTEALMAIDRRECTAVEIVRACLARIAAREAAVQAWQWRVDDEELIASARASADRSPMVGLLYAAKDNIDTATLPTEYGSPRLYAGHRPSRDAAAVAILRHAGAVLAGKTVTTEFAYFSPGKTSNPHAPDRSPGGSSSGSAAAVADCMVPFALGSQTAASVTRPAAYCGVVGYVCSHGQMPIEGVRPFSPSMDALGIFARSVADVELVRRVLVSAPANGHVPIESMPDSVRIAVSDGRASGPIDDEMVEAVNGFARVLDACGLAVEPLDLDDAVRELTSAHEVVMAFEAARALEAEAQRGDQLSPELRLLLETGNATTEADYRAARLCIEHEGTRVTARLEAVDAIVAPAAPGAAPPRAGTGSPHASRPWQALRLPSVALPAAVDSQGLPLGVQLIGAKDSDDRLLALARWANERLPFSIAPRALA